MINNTNPYTLAFDTRVNHMDGFEKNDIIFNSIKNAVDNYQSGTCITFNEELLTLANEKSNNR